MSYLIKKCSGVLYKYEKNRRVEHVLNSNIMILEK